MRIQTIFRFKLGIRRVRGKEWASDRVGRENMSHHENLIDLMRTALKSTDKKSIVQTCLLATSSPKSG